MSEDSNTCELTIYLSYYPIIQARYLRAVNTEAQFTHPYHVLVHTVLFLEADCFPLGGGGGPSVLVGQRDRPTPRRVAVRRVYQGRVRHLPIQHTLKKEFLLLKFQLHFSSQKKLRGIMFK